jgi:hypothetical protein
VLFPDRLEVAELLRPGGPLRCVAQEVRLAVEGSVKPSSGSALWIFALSYFAFAGGIAGTAAEYYSRYIYLFPFDMGIVIGNCALLLLGLIARVVAQSVQRMEQRLDAIEASPTNKPGRP